MRAQSGADRRAARACAWHVPCSVRLVMRRSIAMVGGACRVVSVLGALQLAACTSPEAMDRCFPVPAGAVARTGMEEQGTSLQGAPPGEQEQGTSLQGA